MKHDSVFINLDDIKDISHLLLEPNGRMKLRSYKDYNAFGWNDLRFFCHQHARYGIPTLELVSCLRKLIEDREAIEIGAGCGDLGYRLGIKMTDSKLQADPRIVEMYSKMGQPLIQYPEDVESIDALEAVKKYKPKVVIASWVTTFSEEEGVFGSCPYGVKEEEILNLVEAYILIGNINSHGDKPILKYKHKIIQSPFIISRGCNRSGNRIWIWDKK